MKFTAQTAALAPALALCHAASGKGRGLHCMSAGRLTFTGTDGDHAVTVCVSADADSDGVCLLPPAFASAVKLYDGDVTVNVGGMIAATFSKATDSDQHEYPLADVNGFPLPPDTPMAQFKVAAGLLASCIDRTLFAASREDGKYTMRGVLWDNGSLVATDSHRLAVAELVPFKRSGLLPPEAMTLIRRLLASCDDESKVGVSITDNGAFVTTDAGSLWTKLVEGRFPSYQEAIPKEVTTTVMLNGPAFLADVRRAALATDNESKRVEFAFAKSITMKAHGASVGTSAVRHVPLVFKGKPVTISFDPAYLLDAGKALAGDVTLTLNGPERSAAFKSAGGLYLIVPLSN